ncbi:glycoside hydrolase family 43 protein [Saccharophagus degradans]|uniref:Putative a-L-arabinofuranosidase n=1 Tax=Saccharophagus degradans (strain 2-40 / ATCC 43961 / DSM 17024) TaxID=203122 RepID=Q21MP0_SACD2|nr:glycoside hydrolase family 43 protein [Saccharophagus degradans]ABD80039.1 putative a-L-arabinofuranosidase [Saccharophagus degradans 2-40]
MKKLSPLIEQRADPYIYKHTDGYYYFTASVPAYDGIELRRAKTIQALATAETVMVWRKPSEGDYSELIWAPEIHFNMGAWYVYFAAAPSREIKFDLFQHRMYAISCSDANPLTGEWIFEGKIDSGIDAFCLDATTFTHSNELYYVWAQKELDVRGNSNLMIAKMETPTKLATKPVRLSKPEYDWEIQGFWVNEGPSIVKHGSRIFISYSGSATDERYAMGILWAEQSADLLDPASWTKSVEPVLVSEPSEKVFGPGHNSFTVDEEGNDMLVYHARNYTEIEGDPLWDPNRHTYVKKLRWDETGMPIFGSPAFEE